MISTLYRYYKHCYAEELEGWHFSQKTNNVSVSCEEFVVLNETPKGYWFSDKYGIRKRWTSKTAKSRFAYPTQEQALNNFIARQRRSIALSKHHVKYSELAIEVAKDIRDKLASPVK